MVGETVVNEQVHDERAVAFNQGYDSYAVGGTNPHRPGTSEYNFWRDGYEWAEFWNKEGVEA